LHFSRLIALRLHKYAERKTHHYYNALVLSCFLLERASRK
jgi:hypothetical protein